MTPGQLRFVKFMWGDPCDWGRHYWSRWTAPEVVYRDVKDKSIAGIVRCTVSQEITIQERVCEVCGLVDYRELPYTKPRLVFGDQLAMASATLKEEETE